MLPTLQVMKGVGQVVAGVASSHGRCQQVAVFNVGEHYIDLVGALPTAQVSPLVLEVDLGPTGKDREHVVVVDFRPASLAVFCNSQL